MPFLNISQIFQERLPGYHRPKYNLNKLYVLLSIISFLLCFTTFYVYFTTFEAQFDLSDAQVLESTTIDANILTPARDFFGSDIISNKNLNNQPLSFGTIELKGGKTYEFSLRFPKFVQSHSIYYKDKSIEQFTKKRTKWNLNKLDTINQNIIYPSGIIAETMPFDRIVLLNNNEIFELQNISNDKIDGKKVLIQDDITDLVLPLTWNIQNTGDINFDDEVIFSEDGSSFLPKDFIKNNRLLSWMSIGSFPGYDLKIGTFKPNTSGIYNLLVLDSDINTAINENDVLNHRKYKIKEKKFLNVTSLALPIFLALNGVILLLLAIYPAF
ncbi:Cell cycle control protein [Pseudoloma neurophilia]|uniref:Cell cycle control protein n=1 Tax=Pseudoloma neurophilia TaxID=146866 RepID=A0A0R0M942_9MICR|nr:Cell cycle control protein [Pseudoloma neurophilia]